MSKRLTYLVFALLSALIVAGILIPQHGAAETPVQVGETVTPEDTGILGLVREYATLYGVEYETAVRIARCESRLDPRARNHRSSAKGLYQFTDPTWGEIRATGHQFDVEENIKQFMIWYPLHPDWWVCK